MRLVRLVKEVISVIRDIWERTWEYREEDYL